MFLPALGSFESLDTRILQKKILDLIGPFYPLAKLIEIDLAVTISVHYLESFVGVLLDFDAARLRQSDYFA